MHTKKNVDPRTVIWGTPDMTSHGDEKTPSITTHCNRLHKSDLIHWRGFPLISWNSNFCINLVCGTLSKALEKSKIPISTCNFLLLKFLCAEVVQLNKAFRSSWRSNWSEVDEIVLKHLVSSANCRRWLCAFYTAKIGIFLHKRWQLPYCQKWQHHIGHIAYLDFFLFLLDGKWSIGHPCFLVDMIIECISQAKLYPGWPSTWPPSLLN